MKDPMMEAIELDHLRRKLMYVGYEKLGLRYLMPLQKEIEARLQTMYEKARNERKNR